MTTADVNAAATADGTATGRAHAKAILFGEHSVVYGSPALAVPLFGLETLAEVTPTPGRATRIESDLYSGPAADAPTRMAPVVTALRAALDLAGADDMTVQLRISSGIPHSRGLGSSAAVATAIARAVAEVCGTAFDLHSVVQTAEGVAHDRPSGIDARAVAASAPIRFDSGTASAISLGTELTFVLADSGVAGSTAVAVRGVRALRERDPGRVGSTISALTALTEAAVGDLRSGDIDALGSRMLDAHRELAGLGVSTPVLDALVDAATTAGAPGAKLTGGGLGGCVLALAATPAEADVLAARLRDAGAARTWTTVVPAT